MHTEGTGCVDGRSDRKLTMSTDEITMFIKLHRRSEVWSNVNKHLIVLFYTRYTMTEFGGFD